jgi:hypothetical protein
MTSPAQPTAAQGRPIRMALRVVAAALLLATLGFWAAKGAHTGWTQNQVPMKQTDEVTGIEFVTYEKRYVPGVDFLGLGAGLAAGFFAVSFLVQRKSTTSS